MTVMWKILTSSQGFSFITTLFNRMDYKWPHLSILMSWLVISLDSLPIQWLSVDKKNKTNFMRKRSDISLLQYTMNWILAIPGHQYRILDSKNYDIWKDQDGIVVIDYKNFGENYFLSFKAIVDQDGLHYLMSSTKSPMSLTS